MGNVLDHEFSNERNLFVARCGDEYDLWVEDLNGDNVASPTEGVTVDDLIAIRDKLTWIIENHAGPVASVYYEVHRDPEGKVYLKEIQP